MSRMAALGRGKDDQAGHRDSAFRADDAIPFADSEEIIRACGLPMSALIEAGSDHRLADPASLAAMLRACEKSGAITGSQA